MTSEIVQSGQNQIQEPRGGFRQAVSRIMSGIPMLVRQRSGGEPPETVMGTKSSIAMGQRGRRASIAPGGPRRQLSRRVSRRDTRRSRSRRRSSVHPPITHITIREPVETAELEIDEREKEQKHPIRRLSKMITNAGPAIVRRMSNLRRKSVAHAEIDELELVPLRYRPEGIEHLSQVTKFTKEEIQFMYRGFKQECPTGVISEETFKSIYGKFFPLGGPEDGTGRNTAMYAHYVFGTMDVEGSGHVTFGEFIAILSVLLKGSLEERIKWVFNLYDINNDGYITKEELIDIASSIYDLMGNETIPGIDDYAAVEHVDRIFNKLDLNGDGVVTIEEFMEYCHKNENVSTSLNLFVDSKQLNK